jgi:hypothetical protein
MMVRRAKRTHKMTIATMSERNICELQEVMRLMEETVIERKEYLKAIIILFDMKETFSDDAEFCRHVEGLIEKTKDLWKDDIDKKKRKETMK